MPALPPEPVTSAPPAKSSPAIPASNDTKPPVRIGIGAEKDSMESFDSESSSKSGGCLEDTWKTIVDIFSKIFRALCCCFYQNTEGNHAETLKATTIPGSAAALSATKLPSKDILLVPLMLSKYASQEREDVSPFKAKLEDPLKILIIAWKNPAAKKDLYAILDTKWRVGGKKNEFLSECEKGLKKNRSEAAIQELIKTVNSGDHTAITDPIIDPLQDKVVHNIINYSKITTRNIWSDLLTYLRDCETKHACADVPDKNYLVNSNDFADAMAKKHPNALNEITVPDEITMPT